jgi:hypothetical protein
VYKSESISLKGNGIDLHARLASGMLGFSVYDYHECEHHFSVERT